MKQVPETHRHGQAPRAAVDEDDRLSLQKKAHRPVRPLGGDHLRQGCEGIVLDQLGQFPHGEHMIDGRGLQPPLDLVFCGQMPSR